MQARKRNVQANSRTVPVLENPRVSFSVYQFARRHGVTPPTIYHEIYDGHLPAMRIGKGGALRITSDHEAEWIRRRAFSFGADSVA
jgi:hypothetical protein